MFIAAQNGNFEIIKLLVESGAVIDSVTTVCAYVHN